jgi:iron complex transport system ATP-binding protein
MLEARSVSLAYARDTVVTDFSGRIERGEFVGLIGPNGAGKSALLKAFARLLKPSAGTVLLDGADIWSLPPRTFARRVARVPSTLEVPADLTVQQLLQRARFPHHRLLAGHPGDGAAIGWALGACEIEYLIRRSVSSLSAGERQRASIAAGLAQQPSVLLLDEPTAFLDLQHALETLSLLADLNRSQGLTIVVALHDLVQAARYCSRILVIDQGRTVADGPPDAVIRNDVIGPVFGVDLRVFPDPVTGHPVVLPYLPQARQARRN